MQLKTMKISRFYVVFCVIGVVLSQTLCALPPLPPTITSVSLSTPVKPGVYGVVFSNTPNPADAIDCVWVDPGSTSGDSITAPTGIAATSGATAAPAYMYGDVSGFGTMLYSMSADNAGFGAEATVLRTNMPTNHNVDLLGATGPVNKANI